MVVIRVFLGPKTVYSDEVRPVAFIALQQNEIHYTDSLVYVNHAFALVSLNPSCTDTDVW